jgi:hypothetical protein
MPEVSHFCLEFDDKTRIQADLVAFGRFDPDTMAGLLNSGRKDAVFPLPLVQSDNLAAPHTETWTKP